MSPIQPFTNTPRLVVDALAVRVHRRPLERLGERRVRVARLLQFPREVVISAVRKTNLTSRD